MTLRTFLAKEVAWSRHRKATLLILFVLVPAVFATGTLFFEHTLPENSPVAVVPQNESVTADELQVVSGGISVISDPTVVDSMDAARHKLHREEVYAIVHVPPGMTTPNASVTLDIYVDGTITIFRLPSQALVRLLGQSLDGMVPTDITATRHVLGEEKRLAEYLLPTFLMLLVMLVAFVYVPAAFARESNVLDRLRARRSLERVVAAKLLYVSGLLIASVLTVYLVGLALGYRLEPLSVGGVGSFLLAFLGLAALATSITFLTRFSLTGRVLNVAVFFALIPASNLAYPVGSFSPISKAVARHNPFHYAMIAGRSHLLKETSLGTFADWLGGIVVVVVGCVVLLWGSIRYYERTQ